MCILKSDTSVGVREIWRSLDLSSPSLAQYHVNKLLELQLIEADIHGKYTINNEETIEALRNFMNLRGMIIPRLTIYATLLLGILSSYIMYWPWRGDFRDLTVLVIGLISVGSFIFEAFKQYQGLMVQTK
jgi:hypothetical protein